MSHKVGEILTSSKGRRVVVVCKNNLRYAGIIKMALDIDNKKGGLFELDHFSGLCVWIPLDFIKELKIIPIIE